jgi:hypothetical protein
MSKNFLIRYSGLPNPRDGLARNNQDVSGGLRRNVSEGATDRITVNDIRRDFTIIDLFEKRLHDERRIATKMAIASSGSK